MLRIYICVGSSCHLKGSYCVINTFEELIKRYGLEDLVELKASFCLGRCTKGVSAKVGDTFIEDLLPENAEERFNEFILQRLMVRV
ncbi:MAG TPA: (2Fe-2S) ferredoxin domain-containing protein [Clostridiales bacterium]|nr:(2Fe-2S) ferredoxin domain-containing protein [Clostridiales bacterium]